MRRFLDSLTIGCLASALATNASAAPLEARTAEEPSNWYGWQTLALDATAVGLAAVSIHRGLDRGSLPFTIASLTTYFAGPPLVHFAHGEIRNLRRSLELRSGLPMAGLALGLVVGLVTSGGGDGHSDSKSNAGAGVAYALIAGGFLAPMVVDAATASESSRERSAARTAPQTAIAPAVQMVPGGSVVSLAGWF